MGFWEWMCLQHISVLDTQPVGMCYPYEFTCSEWCVRKTWMWACCVAVGGVIDSVWGVSCICQAGICSVFIMVLRTMRYLMGRHMWSVWKCVWERVWKKGEVRKWPCTEPRQIRTLHGGGETEEETSVGDGNEKWDRIHQLLPQPQKECWYHARMNGSLTVRHESPRWEEGWLRMRNRCREAERGQGLLPWQAVLSPQWCCHQNPRVPLLGPRKANSYIP